MAETDARAAARRAAAGDDHDAMKVVRIERGWETGTAQCVCGREFPVTFSVTRVRDRERIVIDKGQRCPDDDGPEHRAILDRRFADWWANAGRHVTSQSPRKGLAYLAFCAGMRFGLSQPAILKGSEEPGSEG